MLNWVKILINQETSNNKLWHSNGTLQEYWCSWINKVTADYLYKGSNFAAPLLAYSITEQKEESMHIDIWSLGPVWVMSTQFLITLQVAIWPVALSFNCVRLWPVYNQTALYTLTSVTPYDQYRLYFTLVLVLLIRTVETTLWNYCRSECNSL